MNRVEEVRRIRDVYDGYAREGAARERWSTENPGNTAALNERARAIEAALRTSSDSTSNMILDVGCGSGSSFHGLDPVIGNARVIGLDLQLSRLLRARTTHPEFDYLLGDASMLPVPSSSVDVILCFTVFSSILDATVSRTIADELRRVLASEGMILLYDMRVNSPGNPNVHALRRKDVDRLFDGMSIQCKSMSVLPPLVRRLGRATKYLYPLLTRFHFLHTHHLCVIQHA